MRAGLVALGIAIASPASAATIHGLVYDDINGDGQPSAGEPGIADAVVAAGARVFGQTDASGQFDLEVPGDAAASSLIWVRVPDGFVPGPTWARWDGKRDVDLGLRRLAAPIRGPLTFVVAADTHIATSQDFITGADLALAATAATALEPAPAFFTILGDITQGNKDAEFELVDQALAGLGVPWVPVPGNHDWYDEGEAWFRHYGPDNYSFDLAGVHFVVWNMAMAEDDIRAYLGAELARVPRTMPGSPERMPGSPERMLIVALTHAPPSEPVIDALRDLGVDYVLTGHAHSNRVVDHDNLIELNTEPMLMGGLDFTPAGYRIVTIDGGRMSSVHRTTVEEPFLAIVSPATGRCTPSRGAELIVAAELDAGASTVAARIDCATPITLRAAGGWNWRVELPALSAGVHTITATAASASGTRVSTTSSIDVCEPPAAPAGGLDWPQLGGGASHEGARSHEIAPPLVTRWTAAVGGHVITAAPAIANGAVFVAVTDLADGSAGGIVALELSTGKLRWRAPTAKPVRGGVAVTGGTVIAPQIDGVVLGLDAATGTVRWRHELSNGLPAQACAVFASPTVDGGDALVGHQRAAGALTAAAGTPLWMVDPVPEGMDSQTTAGIAVGDGLAVGTFNRAIGGLIAWDRSTGKPLWSYEGEETVAINASPVIGGDQIFIANAADEVSAFDLAGQLRWRVKLDSEGFEWGNATVGTPALAHGILVVPTLYRDLVALDAATGVELWRHAGVPGPLRTTHYRSAREAGFAASPVITGDIVWTADTSGTLSALELRSGRAVWSTRLGVPVLAGLAASGDWLVVASYDGTVRALVPTSHERVVRAPASCSDVQVAAGCCEAGSAPAATWLLVIVACVLLLRRRS